jgi:hypothetical protein
MISVTKLRYVELKNTKIDSKGRNHAKYKIVHEVF